MSFRNLLPLLLLFLGTSVPGAQENNAQRGQAMAREHRAIRRDIPLTEAIQGAWDAGTRSASGRPGVNYWQLETDFEIHVRLDPSSSTLFGTETIQVHNNSPSPLGSLSLRLDHNIFRERNPRGKSRPAELTDGMQISRLAVRGVEADLSGRDSSKARPRVRNLGKTLAQVRLDGKLVIQPGESVPVEITWSTRLPGGDDGRGHRMTQRWGETLVQPTQWFPRLAKYDDLRGWDTNIYLGQAEFYNNFGSFDVSIEVPGGWLVSGTGVLQNPEQVLSDETRSRLRHVLESDDVLTIVDEGEMGTLEAETLTWRFHANKVNDFAWASAENYMWRATRASIPGRGPVPIHMLFLPERARLFANAGPIARHALEFYSKLWAAYPFPQLTMQDGPSAGMEYPMVINSNQGACDHEVAHQWWPMMLGTNETWYGWMDEGFNTFMNTLSDADANDQPFNLNGKGQGYGSMSGDEWEPPMMWVSNYSGPLTGFQTYVKTEMMFSMLGGIVGDQAVQEGISNYTQTWAFKHPSPWDFAFFMSNELNMDLGWFWYYWLFTTERVDGSIESVRELEGKTVVRVRQEGEMPSPVVLKVQFDKASAALEPVEGVQILDEHTAVVRWPVDVWFDGARSFDAEISFGDREIKRITLDPDRRFPDKNTRDNIWRRKR